MKFIAVYAILVWLTMGCGTTLTQLQQCSRTCEKSNLETFQDNDITCKCFKK